MLDSKTRKLLNFSINKRNEDNYCSINKNEFIYHSKVMPCGNTSNILHYLEEHGYVDDISEFRGGGADFHITHKGCNYKAFMWLEFRAFLMKSVIVPIIVAILTTFITLFISGVFK